MRKENASELVALDLANLVLEVVALVHGDARVRNVRISVEFDEDLPPVRADRVQLQQVMLNILLNAFDAMEACPAGERELRVRVRRQDDRANLVAVSDCGTGLSAADLDRIFQPFYTTKHEGLGMGLSICRSIVEAHGGRLWAENNPDRGATFYFTLPADYPGVLATEVGAA